MKQLITFCSVAGLFATITSFAATEYWNDFGINYKGIENTQLNLLLGQRDKSGTGFYFYDFKPAAKYSLNQIFDALGGYRLERTKSKTWGTQHRFEGGFGLKSAIAGFTIYDSNQIEHILPPNGAATITNYKNKLTLTYPVEAFGQGFKVSAGDELFYYFKGSKFNRNRIIGGLATNIMQNVNLNVGYMYESVKTKAWKDSSIFTTAFIYSL